MADDDYVPQIYLITPSEIELSQFQDRLSACLDVREIACLRLSLGSRDEDRISRAADALRQITEPRDVALVLEQHTGLAQRLGLDGVHLTDAARSVKAARKSLGADAIVGAFCGQSSHDGMNAGELGADYVAFGPVGDVSLYDGEKAPHDLFAWWSQMIEVPVVAEGGLTRTLVDALAPHTDFFGIGDEIWSQDDPAAALSALIGGIAERT